jgi:hypothetical protein
MKQHKKDLAEVSTRRLLARRRALAGRLGDVQRVLAGSLVTQTRRCGKPGCRCAEDEPHGPYVYFSPRAQAGGRLRYVPAGLSQAVQRYLRRHEEIDTVLAESSAINTELLARRELS